MGRAAGKLAVIGGGPSGLVALKFALEQLHGWEIVCFERQDGFYGSWGKTHPGFVSTSTRYTTQFACFQKFSASLGRSHAEAEEFFRADEFGDYLNDFVSEFGLAAHVRLEHAVLSLQRHGQVNGGDQWVVRTQDLKSQQILEECFTHVVICSGLADRIKPIASDVETLGNLDDVDSISDKTIVVFGGGESAVDIAERLCQPDRCNKVYLSLRSGIRVSPRYHPIKNIPSDFLRNRLMLSIHEDIRNSVGQAFVEFRIRFDGFLRAVFPSRQIQDSSAQAVRARKSSWNLRINSKAKGKLFNMFHNKSDDFLTSIAEQRLFVIGPAVDSSYRQFHDFDRTKTIELQPDLLVNAIGFESRLAELAGGSVHLRDFFLGCIHKTIPTLFCVGYARPIIGNIPTIAELQARYVIGMIAGQYARPNDLEEQHERDANALADRYPAIDINSVYPVDMFPYCDRLAKAMHIYPKTGTFKSVKDWLSFWLSPAATNQYLANDREKTYVPPNYTPWLILVLLLMVKLVDIPYRIWQSIGGRST